MTAHDLRSTHAEHQTACVNAVPPTVPLPYNEWVTRRLIEQDKRIAALEAAQREQEGDGK